MQRFKYVWSLSVPTLHIHKTNLLYFHSKKSNKKKKERNSAIDMWQTALKLVSALENELKDYRDNSQLTSALEKVHEVYTFQSTSELIALKLEFLCSYYVKIFFQVRTEYSRAISLLEEKLAAASSRLAKDKAARELAEEKVEQLENNVKLLTERYEKRCADVDEALIGVLRTFRTTLLIMSL